MRGSNERNYLIVTRLKDDSVQTVLEALPEHAARLPEIDQAVIRKWRSLMEDYPYPEFDVLTARADSIETLRNAFPELVGWESAKQDTIHLSMEA